MVHNYKSYTDFLYQADIYFRGGSGNEVGLLFRAQNPGTGNGAVMSYYVGLNERHDRIVFGRINHGYAEIKRVSAPLNQGVVYRVRIEAQVPWRDQTAVFNHYLCNKRNKTVQCANTQKVKLIPNKVDLAKAGNPLY